MAPTIQALPSRASPRTWLLAIGGTLLIVVAGFALPRAMAALAPDRDPVLAKKTQKAANSLAYQPPAWPQPPSAGKMLGRLLIGTVAVLCLCGFTLWVGRKWLGAAPSRLGQGRHLQILETLPLGRRCCLFLVGAGKRQVIVGMDSSGIKGMVALPEAFENALGEFPLADKPVLDPAGESDPDQVAI